MRIPTRYLFVLWGVFAVWLKGKLFPLLGPEQIYKVYERTLKKSMKRKKK